MPRLSIPGLKMQESSPTKRRKTKGNTMKSKQAKPNSSWPIGNRTLPVEIFDLIAAYLPRQSVQDMRLVCREFEEKVSGSLFKVVVVPFRPEIYGITPEPALGGMQKEALMTELLQGSVMLQDKGMRVFQGFGQHIMKFALSFEFDEEKLARPPIKSDQEAITAFWGIYRWPFKTYNRYAQLEGLEQTADETRTMAKALRFITRATELGLSVDGGLGWLAGPDINSKVVERGNKVAVFGESRFMPDLEPKVERSRQAKAKDSSSTASDVGPNANERSALERMLQEAGYQGADLERSVETLLETDRSVLPQPNEHVHEALPERQSNALVETRPRSRPRLRADQRLEAFVLVAQNNQASTHQLDPVLSYSEDEEEEGGSAMVAESSAKATGKSESSLKPNDLNNAQREMLLEIEWAQRAFMQSYAIAIIDSRVTFTNVKTFTIARLPTRHLPIIRREDFWDSLPQLEKLSIAIIPDWREVNKLPTSWVQDNKLAPSLSVSAVYQLLKEQISQRRNITTLHFEWLCGGEEAPGIFARNQHILAAPLTSKAVDMVDRRRQPPPQLLELPHVQHLSLKNCWVSPHILTQFVSSLEKGALESLKLDSVSLSAPVTMNTQPNPLNGHPANNQAAQNAQAQAVAQIGIANGFPALANLNQLAIPHNAPHPPQAIGLPVIGNPPNQPPPLPPNAQPQVVTNWFDQPRHGSWADVIETVTPGETLANIRFAQDRGPEPAFRIRGRVRKLAFSSCGYVRLPLDFDQSMLDPPEVPAAHPNSMVKRMGELEGLMMKPNDFYLGVIVNHINATEERTLENAWNMNLGWGTERAALAAESAADGIRAAGHGRFTGVIEVDLDSGRSS